MECETVKDVKNGLTVQSMKANGKKIKVLDMANSRMEMEIYMKENG